jgi:hypothetical protein
VAVAVSCSVSPAASDDEGASTLIFVRVGADTVTVMEPEVVPMVAVTVIVPALRADSIPELLTDATVESDVCQAEDEVTFWVLWSL